MIKFKDIANNYKFSLLKKTDTFLWVLFGLLVFVSITAYFTAASQPIFKAMAVGNNFLAPLNRHVMHLILGVLAAFVVQFIPIQHIQQLCKWGFWISIGLLIIVMTPLGHAANGTTRWLGIGSFHFQPSELAKLTLIVYAGDLLARAQNYKERVKTFWIVLGMTILVCALIISGNLSTCILLTAVIFAMMLLADMPFKHIGITIVVGIGLAIGSFFIAKQMINSGAKLPDYVSRSTTWVSRIDNWISNDGKAPTKETDPEERIEINDQNRQAMLAKVAIARGGKTPIGVGPGNSIERSYLPLAYEDYIFAIIVEETGIIGAISLIILYLFLFYHACATTARRGDIASRLIGIGLALMITFQALVHMAVSAGVFPVTGQPLPFISHGGTAIIMMSIYVGIMLSIGRDQKALKRMEEKVKRESEDDVPSIEGDFDTNS